MIRTASAVLLLAALLLPALAGCDNVAGQDEFEVAASQAPSGFTATDRAGNVLSTDPDDWRTSPLYAFNGFVVSQPPYPNPAPFVLEPVQPVMILVTAGDAIPGGLHVVAYKDDLRRTIPGAQVDVPGPGTYSFRFNASEIAGAQPGDLWRLVVFDGQSQIVTYGDLMIGD